MKKKIDKDQSKIKSSSDNDQLSASEWKENEKSLGSSNAFDATENPQKDAEREWSDEELDDLIDEKNKK